MSLRSVCSLQSSRAAGMGRRRGDRMGGGGRRAQGDGWGDGVGVWWGREGVNGQLKAYGTNGVAQEGINVVKNESEITFFE